MDFAPNEILLPIAVAPNYFALKFFSALARASLLLASRSQLTLHFQYSQPELEALGVICALSLLRPYLLGKEFTIVTDAKSLACITLSPRDASLSPIRLRSPGSHSPYVPFIDFDFD